MSALIVEASLHANLIITKIITNKTRTKISTEPKLLKK